MVTGIGWLVGRTYVGFASVGGGVPMIECGPP